MNNLSPYSICHLIATPTDRDYITKADQRRIRPTFIRPKPNYMIVCTGHFDDCADRRRKLAASLKTDHPIRMTIITDAQLGAAGTKLFPAPPFATKHQIENSVIVND